MLILEDRDQWRGVLEYSKTFHWSLSSSIDTQLMAHSIAYQFFLTLKIRRCVEVECFPIPLPPINVLIGWMVGKWNDDWIVEGNIHLTSINFNIVESMNGDELFNFNQNQILNWNNGKWKKKLFGRVYYFYFYFILHSLFLTENIRACGKFKCFCDCFASLTSISIVYK